MSLLDDITTAIESEITAHLATYTIYSVGLPLSKIPRDKYPAVVLANPSSSVERIEHQQSNIETEVQVFMLREADEASELRTDLDTLRANIDASGNLGGVVDDAWVNEWAVDETQEPRVVAGLIVRAVKVD